MSGTTFSKTAWRKTQPKQKDAVLIACESLDMITSEMKDQIEQNLDNNIIIRRKRHAPNDKDTAIAWYDGKMWRRSDQIGNEYDSLERMLTT